MSDRSQSAPNAGFAGRAGRTLRNNMESAVMYLPVAPAALWRHLASPTMARIAVIYMIVRTTFTLGYWLRINGLRSLPWLIGMIRVALPTIITGTEALFTG